MHVHNVSGMTREDAESFLSEMAEAATVGKGVCVRLYKRADGTVLTRNCAKGVAAMRQRAWRGVRRVLAAASVVLVACMALKREEARADQNARNGYSPFDSACRSVKPFSWISETLGQERPNVVLQIFMGRMRYVPPTSSPLDHAKDLGVLPRGEHEEQEVQEEIE